MKNFAKRIVIGTVIGILVLWALPVHAQDQVIYRSQPDKLAIFLNSVAFAEDSFVLPGGTDVEIVLPSQIFLNTLLVSENGTRVQRYRLNQSTGQIMLSWESDSDLREITLTYLLQGIGWQPTYDMALNSSDDQNVLMNFFAEIANYGLQLQDVNIQLVAGQVDIGGQVQDFSNLSMNQAMTQEEIPATGAAPGSPGQVGAVTIQNIYEVSGQFSADPGDVVYINLLEATLPARRIVLWNAAADQQATVIYKVRNESTLPLAQGVVRSYRDGLFIGSDGIELTPIGGEGSVTIGRAQDLRVEKAVTRTSLPGPYVEGQPTEQYEVTLTLVNFAEAPVEVEIVDFRSPEGSDFQFSQEPTLEPNNLMRWVLTLPVGEEITIRYQYKQ